jgi:hypothetical protein
MSVLRTIQCDMPKCSNAYQEKASNEGFPGWGSINGVMLNGITNPNCCPDCKDKIMTYIDEVLNNGVE